MDFGSSNAFLGLPYVGLGVNRSYVVPSLCAYSVSSLYSPIDIGSGYGDSFSSDDPAGRVSHLEAITDSLENKKSDDPLDQFLSGKKRFLSESVADILGTIYEREWIKYENLRKIDYDSARTKERLFQIEYWRPGISANIDRLRSNIESELILFEREKRMEVVNCWRDITRLKSELREALREFGEEKRRESLFSGEK